MILEIVQKQKFSQVNDKRHYFSCGIVSLTFYHPNLQKTNQFKWYKKQRIGTCFLKEKEILKELEKKQYSKIIGFQHFKVFTIRYHRLEI